MASSKSAWIETQWFKLSVVSVCTTRAGFVPALFATVASENHAARISRHAIDMDAEHVVVEHIVIR